MGWLATRDSELMARLVTQKDYTTICNSAPSEMLALIALRARDEIIERNQRIVRKNLELAHDFFTEYASWFEWLEPQGSSIAFPRLVGPRPLLEFCQGLLEAKSTMILPGTVFEMPGFFRLGLGRTDFPQALTELRDFLDDQ
jgi:aspartate/methionine/tyrosine aminotransferase